MHCSSYVGYVDQTTISHNCTLRYRLLYKCMWYQSKDTTLAEKVSPIASVRSECKTTLARCRFPWIVWINRLLLSHEI